MINDSATGKSIIGIGCAAHIVHNATATDCVLVDIESVIVKIYKYFYRYTVRMEQLKDFCDFVDLEYQ